jgi:hypothetical protein
VTEAHVTTVNRGGWSNALDGLRSSPLTVGEQATATRLKRHALVCNQKLAGTKVPPLRPVFFNSGTEAAPLLPLIFYFHDVKISS